MGANWSAHEGASFKPPGGIIYFWAVLLCPFFRGSLRARPVKQIKKYESPAADPKAQLRHRNVTARAQQNLPLSQPRPHELRKSNRMLRKSNSSKKRRKPDAKLESLRQGTSSTIFLKKAKAKQQNKIPTSPPKNCPCLRWHRNKKTAKAKLNKKLHKPNKAKQKN